MPGIRASDGLLPVTAPEPQPSLAVVRAAGSLTGTDASGVVGDSAVRDAVACIGETLARDVGAISLAVDRRGAADARIQHSGLRDALYGLAEMTSQQAIANIQGPSPTAELVSPLRELLQGTPAPPLQEVIDACSIHHELFWQRYVDVAERVVEDAALRWDAMKVSRRRLVRYFDHTAAALRAHYGAQSGERHRDSVRAIVGRMLAGDAVDSDELGYDVGGRHTAVVATPGSGALLVTLATETRSELLEVPGPAGTVWAWLGNAAGLDHGSIAAALSTTRVSRARIAFGEPALGLSGMRQSHAQALETWGAWKATGFGIGPSLIHRADVALLIGLTRDPELLSRFLSRELGPLLAGGAREADLRAVARAYLESGQNAVATAAKLCCSRRTVERKLRTVEALIGHPLRQRSAELHVALCLTSSK